MSQQNPTVQDDSVESATFTLDVSATLPPALIKWKDLIEWANSEGVLPVISLIIDATNIANHDPTTIRHITNFICLSDNRRRLKEWRHVDPVSGLLIQLVEAIQRNDGISQCTSEPSKVKAHQQDPGGI